MANKKIHVVHIIPSLNFGGAERMVVDLVNNLDPSIFTVTIIVFLDIIPLAREISSSHIQIKLIPKKGALSFGLFKKLYHELKNLQPDIVHTHLFGGDWWGRVIAHVLGLPIVTTEHNHNISEGWFKHRLKQWSANYTNIYTAPSRSVVEYLLSRYKTYRPIEVIRHGIDLARFKDVALLEENPGIFRLVTIGRLADQKGHTVALQALAGLKNWLWEYAIVGEGPLRDSLQAEAKKLQINERVHFLAPTHDVPKILAANHIVLMPSLWEGLGIVAMEGMAAGRVIVASDADGLKEIIQHQKNGLLAQKGSVENLREMIQWCFENFGKARILGIEGEKEAEREFSLKKMVEKYENIYRSLMT